MDKRLFQMKTIEQLKFAIKTLEKVRDFEPNDDNKNLLYYFNSIYINHAMINDTEENTENDPIILKWVIQNKYIVQFTLKFTMELSTWSFSSMESELFGGDFFSSDGEECIDDIISIIYEYLENND